MDLFQTLVILFATVAAIVILIEGRTKPKAEKIEWKPEMWKQ